MLGFFKDKKKEYEVSCPVCLREFSFKFDPDEIANFDYKYKEGGGFVYSLECDFCDAHASIVYFRNGVVETFDNKWMKLDREHRDGIDAVRNEISSVKALPGEGGGHKLTPPLAELEDRLKKLEKIYDLQVKKYNDFLSKWRDKWRGEVLRKAGE